MAGATDYKKYGLLDYNANSSDAVLNWIKDRFSFKISGRNPGDSSIHWDTYYDIYGPGSIAELLLMKDWASTNGLKYEEMLLHAKVDFTSAVNLAWSQMDKFDNFEGANGILRTADDVTYTDLTATAYSGSVTWQNTMYVGYEEPFDQINLVLSTPGSGITRVWEYWTGSTWATLAVMDGSSTFTVSGRVSFTPPADWARKVVHSSRNKYFVRCRITAATLNPVTSSVKGDNWLRGAGNLSRGWDDTSGSIVNSGELKYNPTPPAGAAAKFPYQSRISYWSSNHFVANPADFQTISGTNTRTWAKYVGYRVNNMVTASGVTGVMCDDGERNISADGIASTSTDLVDKTSNTWSVESVSKYQDIVAYTHALNPDIKVGINAQTKTTVKMGDWNLAEYHSFNWKTNSPRGIAVADSATTMTYDDYLPANNPTGMLGVLIYQDTADTVPGLPTTVWDRGNRGPIVALSKHYIAMNDNTIFSYYTKGGFIYSDTDEVFLKDNSVRHQSIDPIPTVDQVKRWGTYFPAMGVEVGGPDNNGWNGGVRSFTWKLGADIGGGLDVWRRDYTKAIVLHRPATWTTTDLEYTTPSSSMDLGGTFFPLYADGLTRDGITSIALRAGEGAILMKAPVTNISASITSLNNGDIVSGSVTVNSQASDSLGIDKVELYVDDNLYGTVTTAPYTFYWDSTKYTDGTHTLRVKAYDSVGNIAQFGNVSLSVTIPPFATITKPETGANLKLTTPVNVYASDNGTISKVELYVDGALKYTSNTPPYVFNLDTTTFSNGSHALFAKAYDAAGNIGQTDNVTVTVTNFVATPPPPPVTNAAATLAAPVFTISDALLALRIAVGAVNATPEQRVRADVAPVDGKIDINDALGILRDVIGLQKLVL